MEQSDELRFAEIMATMGAVFTPLTDIQLDIYFDCLKEYSINDIAGAAKSILKTKNFTGKFPSIADFVQAIENKSGSLEDKAEIAWNALVWAIERVGHMQSVCFDDHLIHDVVKAMGGWLRVCSADGDIYNDDWHIKNLTWRKKEFVAMYKILSKESYRHLPYLIGDQEASNSGIFDDFVPKITHITGIPGQYVALPMDRPKELPEPRQDDFSKITQQLVYNKSTQKIYDCED